jgi:glycosyltransferase involved in cell wall biosynthesis
LDIKLDKPLLTIAIPTYNRATCLDLGLSQIFKQLNRDEPSVEILISNNNSTDDTEEIVDKYILSGHTITYIKNDNNIGSDRNLLQCFNKARGKYVWIMGDDDVLLDGSLVKILRILGTGDYGLIYLNSYGFIDDYIAEQPHIRLQGHTVYSDVNKFISKSNYFMSFISVNIVNKKRVDEDNLAQFVDTNLVHFVWILSALFNAGENVIVNEFSVAARMYNSGGYKLCEVFAVRANKIFDFFVSKGIDRKKFDIINNKLLFKYFPAQIIRCRTNLLKLFAEDYFQTLYPLYKSYANFWIFTVPAIYLPIKIGKLMFSLAKTVRHYTPLR